MNRSVFYISTVLLVALPNDIANGQNSLQEIQRFHVPEARQAVAVDRQHFYAIDNTVIARYERATGRLQQRWESSERVPLQHLNSGIVRNGRLYCAHSNYPKVPESSSIEIWDTATLSHTGTHSFGITEGSLTWIDWKDDAWWAVFAHYSKAADRNPAAKPTRWTSLVKLDQQWRRLAAWVFPQQVIARFEPNSCSGGAWGPDGALYCTGHDHGEIYRLLLPQSGSTLQLTEILRAPITGQGIAWSPDGTLLYGINRPKREVVVSRVPDEFRHRSE